MNKKIKDLQREIEEEKIRMAHCNHDFKEAKYDPETISVGYGSVQDGCGPDPHWRYAGYRDEEKPRWSRECKICGKIEYTYTQEPIIKEYKPRFK